MRLFSTRSASPRRWRTGQAAALLSAALLLLAGAAMAADPMLRLQTHDFDPVAESFRAPAEFKRASRASSSGAEYFIVQLKAKAQQADVDALRSAGWELMGYVPENAFIVRAPKGKGRSLASIPSARWAGPLEPGMKLSRETMADYQAAGRAEQTVVVVSMWPGEDRREVGRAVQVMGGEILQADRYVYTPRLLVRVESGLLPELAAMSEVQYIEPRPNIATRNTTVSANIQSGASSPSDMGATPVWDAGIHGEGQVIGHIDGAIDRDHCFFEDTTNNTPGPGHRKLAGYRGPFGSGSHGTHTAGTAAGKSSSGDLANAGIAYEAKLSHSTFDVLDGFGDTPTNVAMRFMDAQNDGAFVHTNSWGDDGIRNYTHFCVDMDTFSWDNEDALVMVASTNGSPVFTPENAKNVIAVGNTQRPPNHNSHSTGGVGPTEDGRRKPELYAPGTGTISAASGTSCGTTSNTGTSMASPAITGAAALVRQYYMDGFYPTGLADAPSSFTPSGALVKATLMNGSTDMTNVAGYPSNLEGWGRLVLDNALHFDGEARTLDVEDKRASNGDGLAQNASEVFAVSVLDSGEPLKITLVWHDPPVARQTNAAFDVTVNDLNLTVQAPGGETYLGNVYNTSLGESMTGGSADPKNNVEMVELHVPATGGYIITVDANTVNPMFGDQGFALVVSGALAAGQRGVVQFDESFYPCGATATITLNDGNAGAGPIDVELTSDSLDSETVSLTMVEEGRYVGTIVVDDAVVATGNGALETASGETIHITYMDADTGDGMPETITGSATLDCDAPTLVGEPVVLNATNTTARIGFSANEPVTATVSADSTCGGGSFAADFAPDGMGGYEAELTGLAEGTLYFFSISATDRAGNTASFDNGAVCYTFFTKVRTVAFETDFESGDSGFMSDAPSGSDWTLVTDGLAHSPTHAFFVPNDENIQDASLVSPSIVLGDSPGTLNFWHTYEIENSYDGGALEITTNAGGDWTDLGANILVGNYNEDSINDGFGNPLGGRPGWSGGTLGAMTEVVVDLNPYANQTVQVRWRLGADNIVDNPGWYVDDISISSFEDAPGSNNLGAISFDAGVYACGATATILVGDGNLSGPTVDVTLTSTSGDTETVTLSEVVEFVYEGTIAIGGGSPIMEDGTLDGVSGQTLTATYSDADDGLGSPQDVTDTATLDCDGPVISNVLVDAVTDTSATVTFGTDEPATGMAFVAESCGGSEFFATVQALGGGLYSASFSGLAEGTAYYARVSVSDAAGNLSEADNGGLCYEFVTLVRETAFETDFEAGEDGFAGTADLGSSWTHGPDPLAHSPMNAYAVPDDAATQDSSLVSPEVALGPNPGNLSFWHTFQFEDPDWDGGALEISTDSGMSWNDITAARFVQGGYTGTIRGGTSNPLAGREGWIAGTMGTMTEVVVDLSDFADQTIQLRWRAGADGSQGEAGWLVDDISISRLTVVGPPTAAEGWNLYE